MGFKNLNAIKLINNCIPLAYYNRITVLPRLWLQLTPISDVLSVKSCCLFFFVKNDLKANDSALAACRLFLFAMFMQ